MPLNNSLAAVNAGSKMDLVDAPNATAVTALNAALAAALYGTAGVTTWLDGAPAASGVSMAESLRYTEHLAEGLSTRHQRYLTVPANMGLAAWNTVASHNVFTVTGAVRMQMWITCADTLTDAADLATISFGYEGSTAAFIGATDAAGKNAQTLTAGQLWYDTSPTSGPATFTTTIMDYVIPNGTDVGYEIAGEALTGGLLNFHCVWQPLNATGAVVIGDGAGFGA